MTPSSTESIPNLLNLGNLTYYKGVCYAPLYIFCGHHLLVAKLRSSNVDPVVSDRL